MKTTKEIAESFGVRPGTVSSWIREGLLSGEKKGGMWWILEDCALDDFVPPKKGREPAPTTIARATKGGLLHAVRQGRSLCGQKREWVICDGVPTCKRCRERLSGGKK